MQASLRAIALLLLPSVLLGACAQVGSRPDAVVTGTLDYVDEASASAPVSLRVTLLDMDGVGGAQPVAEVEMAGSAPPTVFTLHYDARAIDQTHGYALQAQLTAGNRLLSLTTEPYPVITRGFPAHAELVLRAPGEAASAPAQ